MSETNVSEAADTLPRFVADLCGWYSMTMLALGSRVGLLDALREGGGTVEEISGRSGVDPRNGREWLRAVTAGGHAVERDGRFELSPETAMVLGPDFPIDARAVIAFAEGAPAVLDSVVDAMVAGSGVDPGTYERAFGAGVARINTPIYLAALVPEWISGVLGMTETLSEGGMVADLACGNGDAAALIAAAFPATRVVGFDQDTIVIGREALPDNVELVAADAKHLPRGRLFDLVVCLDSLHHLGDPGPVVQEVHAILKPGGVFLIAEPGLTGDLTVDSAEPIALIVYASSVMYCLQQNLAAGGAGQSGGDGPDWVLAALEADGFRDCAVSPSATGFNIITGRA